MGAKPAAEWHHWCECPRLDQWVHRRAARERMREKLLPFCRTDPLYFQNGTTDVSVPDWTNECIGGQLGKSCCPSVVQTLCTSRMAPLVWVSHTEPMSVCIGRQLGSLWGKSCCYSVNHLCLPMWVVLIQKQGLLGAGDWVTYKWPLTFSQIVPCIHPLRQNGV